MTFCLKLLTFYRREDDKKLCFRHETVGQYISIEKEINKTKDYYYSALQESSERWAENRNSYLPFAKYMIKIISDSYEELNRQFIGVSSRKGSKEDRIKSYICNSILPVSKVDIINALPDVSTSTIQATLSKLLKAKQITKIGTFKDVKYKGAIQSKINS